MMRRSSLIACTAAGAALLVACAKEQTKADSTAGSATATRPDSAGGMGTRIGETGGMKTPESVRYDPGQDVYFVSNINGNPSVKDNNGFIARVRADSTSV